MKELDRDLLAKKTFPSYRPIESGQNEKAHNYTWHQGVKWKSHKGGHFEAYKHLAKLLIRVSEQQHV